MTMDKWSPLSLSHVLETENVVSWIELQYSQCTQYPNSFSSLTKPLLYLPEINSSLSAFSILYADEQLPFSYAIIHPQLIESDWLLFSVNISLPSLNNILWCSCFELCFPMQSSITRLKDEGICKSSVVITATLLLDYYMEESKDMTGLQLDCKPAVYSREVCSLYAYLRSVVLFARSYVLQILCGVLLTSWFNWISVQ